MKKLFIILGFIGLGLLFVPELSAQNYDESVQDKSSLYDENETGLKTPKHLPYVREADVMWKKTIWREIDFRQKMNQGFYYPTEAQKNQKNLYTILKEALLDPNSGVVAYTDKGDPLGDLINPIAFEDVNKIFQAEDNGDVYEFSSKEVERCQIREEWYFDRQRSELFVRIMAICPVRYYKDGNGEKAKARLFWVPYDDNLRMILINSPYFNRFNSSARLSYDDVFLKRQFDSYIIAEDNVFDRRTIEEYAKGIEGLRESERIKQSIIDFEQSLWEY